MPAKTPDLSNEDIDCMIDMFMDFIPFNTIRKEMGFGNTKVFLEYVSNRPEIANRLEAAKKIMCLKLENELYHVADDYDKNTARTKLDAITRLLKFIDPKKYGDKLNLEVTHVDISGSLDRAENRIIDVSPVIPLLKPTS